jgi:hypothetical protein
MRKPIYSMDLGIATRCVGGDAPAARLDVDAEL